MNATITTTTSAPITIPMASLALEVPERLVDEIRAAGILSSAPIEITHEITGLIPYHYGLLRFPRNFRETIARVLAWIPEGWSELSACRISLPMRQDVWGMLQVGLRDEGISPQKFLVGALYRQLDLAQSRKAVPRPRN